MQELKLSLPTYHGTGAPDREAERGCAEFRSSVAARFAADGANSYQTWEPRPDFGPPLVSVLAHEAAGLRVVLGTHDWQSNEFPDVQIERRPNGWALFLHPTGGSDPSGYVYFLDDGRSFVVVEGKFGATPRLELLKPGASVPDLDRPK